MPLARQLLSECARCRHACTIRGDAVCIADGRDAPIAIDVRIQQRLCPIGAFRLGAGDVAAAAMETIGVRRPIKRAIALVTGKPCECPERQAALNKLLPS
jgi:hypothetical protein